jgi:nucleoside-diphosphate-sugar epimerase
MPSRRVLVSGGDGFIGSHLAEELVRAGEQVRALAQYNSFNSLGWLTAAGYQVVTYDRIKSRWLSPSQTVNIGNVLDADAVRAVMAALRGRLSPSSDGQHQRRHRSPREAVEVDIMGTVNMLEAARMHRVKRIMF